MTCKSVAGFALGVLLGLDLVAAGCGDEGNAKKNGGTGAASLMPCLTARRPPAERPAAVAPVGQAAWPAWTVRWAQAGRPPSTAR
jgi:hypothetical protein